MLPISLLILFAYVGFVIANIDGSGCQEEDMIRAITVVGFCFMLLVCIFIYSDYAFSFEDF